MGRSLAHGLTAQGRGSGATILDASRRLPHERRNEALRLFDEIDRIRVVFREASASLSRSYRDDEKFVDAGLPLEFVGG